MAVAALRQIWLAMHAAPPHAAASCRAFPCVFTTGIRITLQVDEDVVCGLNQRFRDCYDVDSCDVVVTGIFHQARGGDAARAGSLATSYCTPAVPACTARPGRQPRWRCLRLASHAATQHRLCCLSRARCRCLSG